MTQVDGSHSAVNTFELSWIGYGGARGVMIIAVGNGHGNRS